MPYKDKAKQQAYLKKYMETYRTPYQAPYMREYRKFQSQQKQSLKNALTRGNLDLAKQILGQKPHISLKPRRKKK